MGNLFIVIYIEDDRYLDYMEIKRDNFIWMV